MRRFIAALGIAILGLAGHAYATDPGKPVNLPWAASASAMPTCSASTVGSLMVVSTPAGPSKHCECVDMGYTDAGSTYPDGDAGLLTVRYQWISSSGLSLTKKVQGGSATVCP